MIWWNKCFDSFLNPKGFDWFSNQSNNMNTKQFSFLLVLVLFKSQVIYLVLSKSQGIWSVERNGLFFFKSQGIWFFTLFSFNLMIGTHRDLMKQMFWFFFKSQGIWLIFLINRIIWTHTNFPSYLFWFFLNPRWFYWFFPNPKGFDLLKEMVWFFLNPKGVDGFL